MNLINLLFGVNVDNWSTVTVFETCAPSAATIIAMHEAMNQWPNVKDALTWVTKAFLKVLSMDERYVADTVVNLSLGVRRSLSVYVEGETCYQFTIKCPVSPQVFSRIPHKRKQQYRSGKCYSRWACLRSVVLFACGWRRRGILVNYGKRPTLLYDTREGLLKNKRIKNDIHWIAVINASTLMAFFVTDLMVFLHVATKPRKTGVALVLTYTINNRSVVQHKRQRLNNCQSHEG